MVRVCRDPRRTFYSFKDRNGLGEARSLTEEEQSDRIKCSCGGELYLGYCPKCDIPESDC